MQIKEQLHFHRDHNGNFIPKLVKIIDNEFKETDTEIYMIPLNRGELLRYTIRFDENNEPWNDADDWIILNKVISPRFTKDDLNRMKISEQNKLITTVLSYSGVSFKKGKSKPLDDFAKRLKDIKEARQEAKFTYFLHERGYSLSSKDNNLNRLTSVEVDMLISEYNRVNAPPKKSGKTTK